MNIVCLINQSIINHSNNRLVDYTNLYRFKIIDILHAFNTTCILDVDSLNVVARIPSNQTLYPNKIFQKLQMEEIDDLFSVFYEESAPKPITHLIRHNVVKASR